MQNCGLSAPADHRIKLKESEKKDKYLDLARKLKKLDNMKVTIIPILLLVLFPRDYDRTSGDHSTYNIIENGQNTEKSPGDLRWISIIQTPMRDHQ